ncbi:MAG: T9SS type A sorting domain-containing protein [Candidatus Kapabacteria bacterium]|nr:T9SS type A sorting domain-containing protein [Ignavibacteriota bacterium]MCW5883888.1 T9SS type A sorting domain-containing protein [Candidatus Kapabacteria bacterium]
MFKKSTLKYFASFLGALILMLGVQNMNVANAQDMGPDNYCIPGPEYASANQGVFGRTDIWCYPSYLSSISTFYKEYMTSPILEVKVTEVGSNEVKIHRISRATAVDGPWEGCYVFTNSRFEMSPGETYDIEMIGLRNYGIFNTTNYCIYNWNSWYNNRIFIDYNLNGVFEYSPTGYSEWINSPQEISSGRTQRIGHNFTWRNMMQANCTEQKYTYRITVSDDQENGVGRMRVMHSINAPTTINNTNPMLPGTAGSACWNGYLWPWWNDQSQYYGYSYGEIEDYIVEFSLPLKGSFPNNIAPDDILLAGEAYDGTTRMLSGQMTYFERPYVLFGNPMPPGSILNYAIVGPLPDVDNVIYEGRDLATNLKNIRVGTDVIGTNVHFNIQRATGPGVVNNYGFRWLNGGEYQLVIGLGKDENSLKFMRKNFVVSWEWDMAAVDISEPLSSGPPRFHKYPRGLSLNLKGAVQNVGLRGVAKFDAYFDIYDSKGNKKITKVIEWDTVNFGQYVVAAKQRVNLDFGTWSTTQTDIYTATLTVKLRSATDMESYNDYFRREDQPAYEFAVKDEIEAAAQTINVPESNGDYIAGRPFFPVGTLSNEGVGDISNAPTRMIITKIPENTVVYDRTVNVEDIPQGRYNLKQVIFPQTEIMQPGTYLARLIVSHPDDLEISNNEYSHQFTVSSGLIGKYTIGTKFSGNARNFATIQDAMDVLYLRGMNGSVTFEFTDAEYDVYSTSNGAPAWDLSTAIMGLGYNQNTGDYWTLTFKPSEDRLVTRASVKINLHSGNGQGVYFGQSVLSTNMYAVQGENFGNQYYVPYSNSGGYITFDGGANKSFRFILNTDQEAFGAVFYLGAGSQNISVKNTIMENNKLSIANKVRLPNAHYSIVDGFLFTPNTEITETGWVGYSAGIVNRAELLALNTEAFVIALDTITNKNNTFMGNDISGFGYGIVSLGIGVLRVPQLADFAPFYNENTIIEGNKIYNVSGAGVVVGNEAKANVKNNVIFDVKGDGGAFAAGIIAGGNATQNFLGYNNYDLNIDGNAIHNVRGNQAVYGILVDQNANKYQVGTEFRVFPPVEDNINVMNNAMWKLNAQNANTMRAGIHMLTQRNLKVADPVARMITPNYADYFIRSSTIANNTILITEDGINNASNVAGIGIQQARGLHLLNNAIAVNDATVNAGNEVASGIFYHGDYPEKDGLVADRNAYWFGNANISAYRHIYTDFKTRVIETGARNEYRTLTQWQMATKSELNSISTGNFINDHYFMGSYPEEIRLRTNTKGSVLTRRGERLDEVTHDIYGNIRGVAGGRYDIGAVEFNGALYNHDAEMLVITEPGTYRATDGMFSDAEYLMTTAPVEVKAIVRNSGNMPVFNKKLYVNIYREMPNGTFALAFGPVERQIDLDATENLEVSFNIGDGIGNDFVPETYNDLRNQNYSVPSQFLGMEANVTPRYRIVVSTDPDEFNSNNATEKISRFYIQRSGIRFLVSNQQHFAAGVTPTADELAYGLNYEQIKEGMKQLNWEIDLIAARYDFDLFNRYGWEPRNVDYTIYRSMIWSDGHNKTLSRLEKLNLTNFVEAGNVSEKKNLLIGSEEMVRNNVNIDDADEVYVTNILRGEYRHPGNPLGAGSNYSGRNVTGIAVGRDVVMEVMATGVAGDMYPQPALMNIVNTGNGISQMAFRYNSVQNPEWPDAARIGGIATTTLTSNVVYLGIDWRHFADIETVLRASFDFMERNDGTVVPVELLSFDAKAAGKRVDISWATASELNTSRFEVEKAAQGSNFFTKIAEMEAAGNSSVTLNYGPVVDNNVEYGKTYIYRLKALDRDGSFSYSDERTVTLTGLSGVIELGQARPNPVRSESTIEYTMSQSANVEITLVDASGKEVARLYSGMQTAGQHILNVDAKDLASGVYQVVLRSGDVMLISNVNVVK